MGAALKTDYNGCAQDPKVILAVLTHELSSASLLRLVMRSDCCRKAKVLTAYLQQPHLSKTARWIAVRQFVSSNMDSKDFYVENFGTAAEYELVQQIVRHWGRGRNDKFAEAADILAGFEDSPDGGRLEILTRLLQDTEPPESRRDSGKHAMECFHKLLQVAASI